MKLAVLSAVMGASCILGAPINGRAEQPEYTPDTSEPDVKLMLVEISLNGAVREGQFLVAQRGNILLVRGEDLDRWRIIRPSVAVVPVDGEDFIPLSALTGVKTHFDTARQRLELSIPPGLFKAQQVSAAEARTQPTDGAFAAFFNYDVSFNYDHRLNGAAFVEAGLSDDWGLVTNSMTLGQDVGAGNVTRLDSFYLRDNPGNLTRLVIGDSVTQAHDWSRQVRFGGVRFGTEFGIQPDLVTFPVPGFTGRASVPSTIELLVNDAMRYQAQVDQGPFSINQIPLVTGSGDVTLVVRDALGVERRVKTSYYVSSRLLSRGLSAWSMEAGGERRNYGVKSFSYRNPFAAGSYRKGVTDWMTVESRAEMSGDVQMVGAGVNLVWPAIGEFGISGAASRGKDGKGALYRVSFSRVTPDWNVAVSYQHASHDFDQLGIDRDEERIADQFQATAGTSFGHWGSLALTYTDLAYVDGDRTRLASANYSIGISNRAYLSVFALNSRFESLKSETTLGIGLTVPFGPQSSGYAQADSQNVFAEVRRTPPTEGGWGYRFAASTGESDRQQAELRWRGDVGEASIEAARFDGDAGLRGLVSGGLLLAGGRGYATRRIQDGLGVVEVPGQAGVRIYQENRLVTRTDDKGRAIIPDLRAYEENRIALAPSDLPLDARMPGDRLIVVPRYRGAASARFAVERDNPATLLLQLPDGKPIEAGSSVRTGDGENLFVGYGGEVFVRELRRGLVLEIDTPQGLCRVTIDQIPAGETLPRIGPVKCSLARRNEP